MGKAARSLSGWCRAAGAFCVWGRLSGRGALLEIIDEKIIGPVLKNLEQYDDYKVMILPDHATPIALRTHVSDPVPFLMYHKNGVAAHPVSLFDEENAEKTGVFIEQGDTIMEHFINFE